jgi:tRNA (guanine37-N1)-methyltransferase
LALKEDLNNILPPDIVNEIPSGFHIIGDIAVISLPPHLNEYRSFVAGAILLRHHNIRTVVSKNPIPRGEFRVAGMELVAGTRTTTVCREYGFSYRLDIARSFYSSKLASERRRVWMQVGKDERVLVPFSGVGPYAIPPAKRGAWVTAIEKNPDACHFFRENASRNRVKSHVLLIEGDVEETIPSLAPGFDRAIIPAPYGCDHALSLVMPLVRQGGILHFYTFKHATQIPSLKREYTDAGFSIRCIRTCGNVAPGIRRYVFDLEKKRVG